MISNQIFFFLYNFSHRSVFMDGLIVFLANTLPYIVVVVAFIFLIFHHEVLYSKKPFKAFALKWKEILLAFFSGFVAWVFAHFLKILLQTSRPFNTFGDVVPLFAKQDFAFPSGHATFFMALAVAIFFYHKKAGYLFMFFAVLIGLARIASGVHSPLDVLGGFVLGAIIARTLNYLSTI